MAATPASRDAAAGAATTSARTTARAAYLGRQARIPLTLSAEAWTVLRRPNGRAAGFRVSEEPTVESHTSATKPLQTHEFYTSTVVFPRVGGGLGWVPEWLRR